ncbi:hypothetical protein KY311_04520 [Candidatus Woesearchaeota archaeon]|nr:hypothetical protein [Candidatus Woesearchaeota archaeon]MBW3017277.1 hypothetical protein [Candidatus Woesearchaeota archaeon]
MDENEPVELYFLKFAYPCSEILRDLGKITDNDVEKLKQHMEKRQIPEREYLEKVFSAAVNRIKKSNGRIWDKKIIRKYFVEEHDDVIDSNEGSYAVLNDKIKNLCRVKKAELVRQKGRIFLAKTGKEERPVICLYDNPKVGDNVLIHYACAVEKLE